jgi:RND family efflux transporter MFP subunit
MKNLLRVLLPILVLAAGVLGAKRLIDSRPEVKPKPPVVVLPTVQVVRLAPQAYQVEIATQGTVVPRTESDVVAEVAGRVLEVSPALVSGGFFQRGELLVRLDSRDYELALAQAKLAVAQAERRLAEEEADAAVALREWGEIGEGEPSALTLREPQVKEAHAALEAAQATLGKAGLDLERTEVRATFDGRIRSKGVDLGQFVLPGTKLARVYAVDSAEVRLPLPDDSLTNIDLPLGIPGRAEGAERPEVLLSARFAGEERSWPARVVRTEGEIDPRTRMVMAVAEVTDPYGLHAETPGVPLAVGMFVEAKLRGRVLEDVFVLPRAALRDDSQVYALSEDDRVQMLDVVVVHSAREEVVVRGAQLTEGQRVVVSPIEIVTEGMQVRDVSTDVAKR